MSNRAVFLDRDGTVIEEVGYCSDPKDVRLYPGTRESIQRLHDAGLLVIIVTNQSGIGLGYFTEAQYHAVHDEFVRQLAPSLIDGMYFNADTPDNPTPRRKPGPGMVLEAARDHDIDLKRSFFVGDRAGDVGAGRAAGTRTVLVETGYGQKHLECGADFVAPDLVAAVDWILKQVVD